jgi:hypothetical protein
VDGVCPRAAGDRVVSLSSRNYVASVTTVQGVVSGIPEYAVIPVAAVDGVVV